jgi:hypothetical protein
MENKWLTASVRAKSSPSDTHLEAALFKRSVRPEEVMLKWKVNPEKSNSVIS